MAICIHYRRPSFKPMPWQCGYCTPGMIVSGAGLLKKNPHPTQAEIKEAMEATSAAAEPIPAS